MAEFTMQRTALLIIDVQQGLCEGEARAFQAEQIIRNINLVAGKARAAKALVVFIQHESKSGALAHGTEGWQLAHGLHVEPGDFKIRKTTPDAFHRTDLGDLLRRHGITTLVICGMHTEFCVDTTTRRALALGFPVFLVEDAHTTEDKGHLSALQIIRHHNATLTQIASFGPRVQTVAAKALRFGDQTIEPWRTTEK